MSTRYLFSAILLSFLLQTHAQDYSPFQLGHEWVYNILEAGVIVGTDTMRCDETRTSGDTIFYYVNNYTSYTDGRPQENPELNIFMEGFTDPNHIYVQVDMGGSVFLELLTFKHAYTDLETYSNLMFSTTSHYIGDYDLPAGMFPDCFWLEVSTGDSTGYIVAPDLGVIATIESGSVTRTIKENNLPPVTSGELSLCNGDSVMLHARYVKDEGIYRDTLTASDGSDSIVLTTVTVLPLSESAEDVSICQGESYFAGGAEQTEAGTYMDTLLNTNGCDSIVTTVLSVLPLSESSTDVTICEGESYFAGGAEQTESGIYYDTYTSSAGCDSMVTTNLTVENCSVSVRRPYDEEILRVYPNPVSGILFIESATLEHIEIFDVFGKLIHESNEDTFDFSALPEGCYYLKCFHLNQDVSVRKVIRQE